MGSSRGERLDPARTDHVANRAQHHTISVLSHRGRDRGAITILDGMDKQAMSYARAELLNAEEIDEVSMTAINKQPARHEIEELLPWYATGRLNRRDADRVEQALAGDRELARRYESVRQEVAETTRLNETLGAPSARAMEKLFAAINAEEARAPRHRRRPISRTRFLNSARDSVVRTSLSK
jgi:hypothetical protein